MLGSTISHYHIKSQLGEGGMGVVYEAEDTNLGRHVALKFLTPSMAKDEALLQRFQREARAASALNHPNICTIHGIEQHESEHFIVMELLDGEPLAERIRRGAIDMDQLLTLGVQIADALESAHSKGIVHRDLKPANIFVTSGGQAKIPISHCFTATRNLNGSFPHKRLQPRDTRKRSSCAPYVKRD